MKIRDLAPLLLATGLALAAPVARAQAPSGSSRLVPAEVSESLAVLKDLDDKVRSNSKDGAVWFRRGMIAWSLAERQKHEPPIPGLNATTLRTKADESLRMAVNFEPDNAYFRLMTGRFLLSSGVSAVRAASYGYFEAAIEAARTSSDPYIHSETAVEAGRVHWRRYDSFADRWIRTGIGPACEPFTGIMAAASITGGDPAKPNKPQASRIMRQDLMICALPDKDRQSGEADYLKAEELFREAFAAQPSNQRAYRQLAMLLVERNRWTELASLARDRIRSAPWDSWAWLTLGLTLHRQKGDAMVTVAAYDSAFRLLPEEEKLRMNRLERIFNPRDSLTFSRLDPTMRFATNRAYWLAATPLWSQQFDEPQLEFLSRVTHSDLRWTVEELNVRGADTDRGDVFIRFGPPDLVASFRGSDDPSGAINIKWTYDAGLVFTFTGMPTFATAIIPPDAQADFAEMVSQIPVRWIKPREFTVDSMPVQVARFRANDSVDVIVATRPPVDSIKKSGDAISAVRSDIWFLAGGTVLIAHDSIIPAVPGLQVFKRRVPPKSYMMRTEASADGSLRGARASAAVGADSNAETGFPTRGFGMSDVVIATTAAEPPGGARRWSDLELAPLAGSAVSGSEVALVWENYDLEMKDGGARYLVALSLRRDSTSKSAFGAKITGALARSVGVDRTDDRITLTFDRNVPHNSILLDNVTLSLADTPPGVYRLTILVTDLVNDQQKVARTTTLTVRERTQ